MKHSTLIAVLGLASFGASAQEVGRVLASEPVIQQVAVPRTICSQVAAAAEPQTSGMGGLAGGIAGAAIGSTIGHGSGTAAAMLLGTVGGALLGNSVEANNLRAQQAAVPTCTTETSYENRTVGYHVTYEYGGRQFTAQMPYDPGPTVQLQVSPIAQGSSVPAPAVGAAVTAPPVQAAAAPVVVPTPAPIVYAPYPTYPAYPVYVPPYPVYPSYYRPYPPVGVSLGFVFGSGHRHYGHRHWGGYRGHRNWRR